jgi:hypothetical protein
MKETFAAYIALYAFSDFVHPQTNAAISEHAVNELKDGELIEQRFEGDDYQLMIVANKFQTGFDQPLLAGMFLDKPVVDRSAVQTLSRLNRCHEGKDRVVVVDFTNNAKAILQAFVKYRKGPPFEPEEPDQELCPKLHAEILAAGVFTQAEIQAQFAITDEEALYIKQVTEEKAADPDIRSTVTAHRDDRIYLEGAYRGQVNGKIQTAYDERGRYEELSDLKYTDTGGIFDIMAVTVIQHHLSFAA